MKDVGADIIRPKRRMENGGRGKPRPYNTNERFDRDRSSPRADDIRPYNTNERFDRDRVRARADDIRPYNTNERFDRDRSSPRADDIRPYNTNERFDKIVGTAAPGGLKSSNN